MAALQREGGGAGGGGGGGGEAVEEEGERKGREETFHARNSETAAQKWDLRDFLKCLRFVDRAGGQGGVKETLTATLIFPYFLFNRFTLIFLFSREALSLPSALLIHIHAFLLYSHNAHWELGFIWDLFFFSEVMLYITAII